MAIGSVFASAVLPVFQPAFKRLLSAALSLSLGLALLAAPARADEFIAQHFKVFEGAMREGAEAYGAKDVAGADAGLQKGLAALRAFEQAAVKADRSDDPEFRQAHRAMRVDLVRLLAAVGESYYEQQQAGKALECYRQAIALEPELPLTQHYAAFMHMALGQAEQALPYLYEAKRLNHLPQMRWFVNPFDESFKIGADGPALEAATDELLTKAGAPTAYPIERGADGKTRQAVMEPGLGANLRSAAGQYANLYFETSEAQLLKQLGQTGTSDQNIMLEVQFTGLTSDPKAPPKQRKLLRYVYPASKLSVSVDSATKQVFMIQSEEPGFSVRIRQNYLSVGDPESRVQTLLGTGYGFQAYDLDGAGVKKMFVYPGLGLVIGMSAEGKVAALNIQSLN